MNIPLHAQKYLELGFAVVPIPAGTKAPKISQWQHTPFTAHAFRPENNIGLLLGTRSQHLVDVDHDCLEAMTLGALLLPATALVHHFRKAEGADPYDAASGSSGLTAAADATMLLKRERQQMTASLALTGRTIREQELALEFSDTGTWVLLGEVAEVRLSEFEREALKVLHEHGPMTPIEYALATGRKRPTVTVQLGRMVSKNLIRKHEGRYRVIVLSQADQTAPRER